MRQEMKKVEQMNLLSLLWRWQCRQRGSVNFHLSAREPEVHFSGSSMVVVDEDFSSQWWQKNLSICAYMAERKTVVIVENMVNMVDIKNDGKHSRRGWQWLWEHEYWHRFGSGNYGNNSVRKSWMVAFVVRRTMVTMPGQLMITSCAILSNMMHGHWVEMSVTV